MVKMGVVNQGGLGAKGGRGFQPCRSHMCLPPLLLRDRLHVKSPTDYFRLGIRCACMRMGLYRCCRDVVVCPPHVSGVGMDRPAVFIVHSMGGLITKKVRLLPCLPGYVGI